MNNRSDSLEAGTMLNNRYEVKGLLKKGGMGSVYKAIDHRLGNSLCAVKEMIQHTVSETEMNYQIKRFKREVKILSELKHPHLPVISDSFVEKNRYYLVMSYIEGQDLETIMDSYNGEGVPEEIVITWTKQILNALEFLHNQSPPIIYRDLKPENVMIREEDKKVVLIDFGLARKINPAIDSTMTAIGTPEYAPEELFQGKPELRVDIYSLGATMHCLLSGKKPVNLFKFKPLREINPKVSEKIEKIVMKALSRNPDDRYVNIKAMIEAINSLNKETEKPETQEKTPEKKESEKPETQEKTPEKKVTSIPVKRKNKILLIIPFFIIITVILIISTVRSPQHWYEKGIKSIKSHDYGTAIEYLNKAINLDEKFSDAHYEKGKVFHYLGQDSSAIKCYDTALNLNPENEKILTDKGIALIELDNYEESIDCFSKAIEINPENIDALTYQAFSLYKINRLDDGLRSCKDAIEINSSNFMAYYNQGVILEQQGNFSDAEDSFLLCQKRAEEYIASSPEDDSKLTLAKKYQKEALNSINKIKL